MKLAKFLTTAVAAGAIAFGALAAVAADYPSKTVKTIVPFGAGGGTDRWARVMSSVAFDVMDVGWHIQNRGGAGGTVGWKYMLDQGGDGHAILMASPTPVIAAMMESKLPLLDVLENLGRETPERRFKDVLDDVCYDVSNGIDLGDAMRKRIDLAVGQGCHARRIIASIFESTQAFDQAVRYISCSEYPDNSAHRPLLSTARCHWLVNALSPKRPIIK